MEEPRRRVRPTARRGAAEQVHEDDSDGEARDEAEESPGVPDNPGQATGNPDNAG